MATTKRRMREFDRCLRSIQSFSDNQAQITEWDEEQLTWVVVVVQPKGGLYEGGKFDFKIYFEKDYPKCQPRVDCLTPIYHPNIDPTCDEYNVCLSLFDEWEPRFGLEDIIQGLLFLLYNPNIEDPLSPYFDPEMDEQEMMDNIRTSLEGKELDDVSDLDFPINNENAAFNEEALNRGIQLILEKAGAMVLCEEEEEENSDSDSVIDMNTVNASADVIEAQASEECDTQASILLRQESKLDKCDVNASSADCDIDMEEKTAQGHEAPQGQGFLSYIPCTFITPQPDFLVTAFMTCLDLAAR